METAPTELSILTCFVLCVAPLWIPYMIGVVRQPNAGGPYDLYRPPVMTTLPASGHGMPREQLNELESFDPYAILDRVGDFSTLTY